MAQNQQTVALNATTWTQLSNADVTAITFQVLSGEAYIRFTTDTTTPTEDHGILYQRGDGELQKNVSALTNLASADRVWGKAVDMSGSHRATAVVYVDHA